MKKKLIEFYLDWVNDWLTLPAMAEHYGLEISECNQMINIGRRLHEEAVAFKKSTI